MFDRVSTGQPVMRTVGRIYSEGIGTQGYFVRLPKATMNDCNQKQFGAEHQFNYDEINLQFLFDGNRQPRNETNLNNTFIVSSLNLKLKARYLPGKSNFKQPIQSRDGFRNINSLHNVETVIVLNTHNISAPKHSICHSFQILSEAMNVVVLLHVFPSASSPPSVIKFCTRHLAPFF